jgi:hypothetical protein
MKDGDWKLNGESIVFDDNGNVIDGQHRLTAIVESGVTIKSVVVRGVDRSTFTSIDSGVRRDGGDILAVSGYTYSKPLAAALNVIEMYNRYGGFHNTGSYSSSNMVRSKKTDHVELAKKYEGCIPSVAYVHNKSPKVRPFRPAAFTAAIHYIFGLESPQARDRFFESIETGIPQYGAACPTLKIAKAYQIEKQVAMMNTSAARRYELWRNAWDAFKTRYDREGRKPAPSMRFTTVNGFTYPEPL